MASGSSMFKMGKNLLGTKASGSSKLPITPKDKPNYNDFWTGIGTKSAEPSKFLPRGPLTNLPISPPQPYQTSVSFWEIAQQKLQFEAVPDAVKTLYSENAEESDASTVLHDAEAAKTNYFRRRGADGGGFQETINKIIISAGKFSSVVDSLTDCDPTHYAKLAWGGIRIFLVAATQNIQLHDTVLEGMAYISALITETLETMTKLVFINQPPSIQNLKTVNLLQERMIKLYVLVLHYLGLTNLYYKKGAWGRATMSLAGPENSEIIRVLNSVRNEEREVRQHYRMVCEERGFQEAHNQTVAIAETQSSLDAVMQGQRRLEKQVESLQSGFYYDIHGAMASSTRDNEEVLKTSDKRLVTLENTVREISNRMQFSSRLVEGELEAERRVKVLQWISPEQYQSRHQALINDIQFDSWSWVYHTPAFEKWYSKNMPPILFIIGPAKSGKSTILAQIIDDLQHHNGYHMPSNLFTPYGNPPSSMVLYFHCRPYNSHSAILGSLLRQLCCQDSATFHLLQAEYENELYHGFPSGSMQSAKLMKHLRSFFTRLLEQRQRTIYIVIGDLERRNFSRKEVLLMSALGELTRVCPGYCKVLIAARELPLGFTKLVIDQNLFFERVQIDRYKFYRQLVEAELKIFAEAFQIPLEQSGTYYMMSKETQGRLARDFLAHESEPWPNWGDETFRNRVLNRFLNAFNSEEKMRKTTASSQDVIDQRETTKQEEMHRPVTPTAFAFSAAERAGGRTDKMHQATFSQDSSRKSPTWRPGRLSSLPTK